MFRESNPAEISVSAAQMGPKNLTFKGFLGLLWYLIHPFKKQLTFAVISLILAAGVVLCLGWGIKHFPDLNAMNSGTLFNIGSIGVFLGFNVLILTIASFGRSYYFSWISERAILRLREKMFAHLLRLDIGFFESSRSGELISRINNDPLLIQIVLGTSLGIALRNFIMFIGGVIMMSMSSPKLSLYTLAIVPIILIPIGFLGKKVRAVSRLTQDKLARLNGFLEERIDYIHTVQAFSHEKYDRNNFAEQSQEAFYQAIHRNKLRALLACSIILLVFVSIGSILWAGYRDVLAGTMKGSELSAFIFYAILVASTAGSFGELYADIQRATGAFERIIEFLNLSSAIKQLPRSKRRKLPSPPRGILAIHNVSFAYPSHPDRVVLKNFTFSVAPGEKLAIVGLSGAGKSTVLNLLMRFYDPQSGVIFMDGLDIKEVGLEELRARISIVAQEPAIFADTLYNNLSYGNPNADLDQMWDVLRAAHLDEFVYSLPRGLDTFVGTKGVRLSGGQKQRLAIARALLRDAPILLLDEATNALDAQSEQGVQAALKHLLKHRTTIMVAHRLSTILSADRIMLIDKGRLSAIGTHAELMHSSDLYKKLVTLQFHTPQAMVSGKFA